MIVYNMPSTSTSLPTESLITEPSPITTPSPVPTTNHLSNLSVMETPKSPTPQSKKRKNSHSDALYNAAVERLSKPRYEEDRFSAYGKAWAMDLRELHKQNPHVALHAKRLIDNVILKAYQNSVTENTSIVETVFSNNWDL